MYVLGVTSPASMNNAAALLEDGEIVAAVEEERFIGRKHAPFTAPLNAISYCLDRAEIKLPDVDHVAVGWGVSPDAPADGDIYRAGHKTYTELMPDFIDALAERDPSVRGRLHYVNHQLAHAASAYYVSGFERANVLTLDGNGERYAGMLGFADGDIEVHRTIPIESSLGHLYEEVTDYLGFRRHRDEGKVMGLASYGEPTYDVSTEGSRPLFAVGQTLSDKIPISNSVLTAVYDSLGPLRGVLAARKFPSTPLLTRLLHWALPPRLNRTIADTLFDDPFYTGNGIALTKAHADLAASVQHHVEGVVLDMVAELAEETGCTKFCLAGGVALNCVLNKHVRKSDHVEKLFVQPAAHDAGTALGAALMVSYRHGSPPTQVQEDVYWGPEYDETEIKASLEQFDVPYEQVDDVAKLAADELADGKIVGWFQGRLEFGPRALGHRSILANPSEPSMKDRVNAEVKQRELWRPFAPALCEERAADLFEDPGSYPFMIQSCDLIESSFDAIPAASHVDQTARPQTVTPTSEPKYYDLIANFSEQTGTPAVLNTSYNISGDPMNRTPSKAIETFLESGMDVLCMGDFIVRKSAIETAP